MAIKSKRFLILLFLISLFFGLLFRFSFIRIITLAEDVKPLDMVKGDKALVYITSQPKKGWAVMKYPDYSEPYIIRKVEGGQIESGSVEIKGEPKVSVIKKYGEIVVSDSTPDAQYGDSRSWGKGVRFDLILGKVLFHIPGGDAYSFYRWKRVK